MPHLLGSVRTPALVVWGDEDRVVPQSAAGVYAKSLPNAKLEAHASVKAGVAKWIREGIDDVAPLFELLGDRAQPPDAALPATGVPARRRSRTGRASC